ncbi:MAG: DUF2199 domain-containing protein [Pseudomonadota bacterium]
MPLGRFLQGLFGQERESQISYECAECGETHCGLPSLVNAEPPEYKAIPELERAARAELTQDTCIIDGQHYFIRANLPVPVLGTEEHLDWGVWVTQSEESFNRYLETYDDDQSEMGSFGWLGVFMTAYKRTEPGSEIEYLASDISWGAPGLRPTVVIHECDHPLYLDQQHGITVERAIELVRPYLHA